MKALTKRLDPKTSAEFRITVRQGTTLLNDCTVVATVYPPASSVPVVTNQAMNSMGAGTYLLTWLASWTQDASGVAREGLYTVIFTVTRAGVTRQRRFRVPVHYED